MVIQTNRGAAKANAIVVNKLFEAAKNGHIVAMIYWTKRRMGWKEGATLELNKPNCEPIPLADVPPPLTAEEKRRRGLEAARILKRAGALPMLLEERID